jgi:hypothetical protein
VYWRPLSTCVTVTVVADEADVNLKLVEAWPATPLKCVVSL